MSLTIRQLYGGTGLLVAAVGISVTCYLSPPRTWKIFQATPKATAARKAGAAKPPEAKRQPFKGDGYAEVAEWLKQNLDDPDFEKVRWWPVESLAELRKEAEDVRAKLEERRNEALEKAATDLKKAEAAFNAEASAENLGELRIARDMHEFAKKLWGDGRMEVRKQIPEFACRLKFRSKNQYGAKVLQDKVFSVDRGVVKPVDDDLSKGLSELVFKE